LQAPLVHVVTAGVGHSPLALHTAADVVRPLVHNAPGPHDVPAALLDDSVHTGEPVVQEFVPFLQGFVG
jgi:hypothetical protein